MRNAQPTHSARTLHGPWRALSGAHGHWSARSRTPWMLHGARAYRCRRCGVWNGQRSRARNKQRERAPWCVDGAMANAQRTSAARSRHTSGHRSWHRCDATCDGLRHIHDSADTIILVARSRSPDSRVPVPPDARTQKQNTRQREQTHCAVSSQSHCAAPGDPTVQACAVVLTLVRYTYSPIHRHRQPLRSNAVPVDWLRA